MKIKINGNVYSFKKFFSTRERNDLSSLAYRFSDDQEEIFEQTLKDPKKLSRLITSMFQLNLAISAFPNHKEFFYQYLLDDLNEQEKLIKTLEDVIDAGRAFPSHKAEIYYKTIGDINKLNKYITNEPKKNSCPTITLRFLKEIFPPEHYPATNANSYDELRELSKKTTNLIAGNKSVLFAYNALAASVTIVSKDKAEISTSKNNVQRKLSM